MSRHHRRCDMCRALLVTTSADHPTKPLLCRECWLHTPSEVIIARFREWEREQAASREAAEIAEAIRHDMG